MTTTPSKPPLTAPGAGSLQPITSDEPWAGILTGAGGKALSAGHDLIYR